MDTHPYQELPDSSYWQQAVSDIEPANIDPVVSTSVSIGPGDLVATAGSCFAQHLSRCLDEQRVRLFKAETLSTDGSPYSAYEFSARYGNIYTARQLLQLFDRAFGYFNPSESVWTRPDGRLCDPFRPRIEPDGFKDPETLLSDVTHHLAAVRRMFRELDVFVFTLGLTESWAARSDGAIYPVAPGVVAGKYRSEQHQFVNFSVSDVLCDMEAFLARLGEVNPRARVIITVSPVPMVATRESQHVLVSNGYSKSVLRAAAGQLSSTHDHVEYFPSYEIITSTGAPNYFAPDRRMVSDAGIGHVMRIFKSRMMAPTEHAERSPRAANDKLQAAADLAAEIEAECDEELYQKD